MWALAGIASPFGDYKVALSSTEKAREGTIHVAKADKRRHSEQPSSKGGCNWQCE